MRALAAAGVLALGALAVPPGRAAGGGEATEEATEAATEAAGYRVTVPPGWRDAPELVAEGAEGYARGFADPTAGGFALVQIADLPGSADPAGLELALRAGLRTQGIEVRADEALRSEGVSELRFGLVRGELRGAGRAILARRDKKAARAGSATCFYNQRVPSLSLELCRQFLESFEVIP